MQKRTYENESMGNLKKLDNIISILCFSAIAVCGILALLFHAEINTDSYLEKGTVFVRSGWKWLSGAVALSAVYLGASWLLKRLSRRSNRFVLFACVMASVILSIIWIYYNPLLPIADQKKLWNAIVSYADGNYQSIDALYYEQYPFQGRLVVLFSFLVRLTNVRSIMLFKAINAVACAAVAVALACISSLLFRKAEVTTLTGVMTFCFLPIVIYSCFIYGTLLSLAMIVWAFYLTISYVKCERKYKLAAAAVLMAGAAVCYSGALIAVIAVSVYLIHFAVKAFINKEKSRGISCFLGVALMCICVVLSQRLLSNCFEKATGIRTDNGVPASAYVLMGITSDGDTSCGPGSYDATNVYIYELAGRDRNLANQEAVKRLYYVGKDYLRGRRNLSFFIRKLRNEWTDPWFSSAVMTVYLQSENSSLSQEQIAFFQSKYIQKLQWFLGAFIVVVYIFSAFYAIKSKSINQGMNLLTLYFLGGFVFYIFWEAKPRYCFPYFVCLIPLAASAIVCLSERIGVYRKRRCPKSRI